MSKVILITGATSGIGETTAAKLSRKGHIVYGTGRKLPANLEVLDFKLLPMDVWEEQSVKQAVDEILKEQGRIDVLVNNAGIFAAGALEEFPLQEVKTVFETNLYGVIRLCQAVIPVMRKQCQGLIINISSIGGQVALPFQSIYSASKFALEGLTESLRMELKPFGIHVCLIEPGDFKTDINRKSPMIMGEKHSPYYSTLERVFTIIHKNVDEAEGPAKVGDMVAKIIDSKKPKLRYKVGAFLQTLSPTMKKFLPNRIFEKVMMDYYQAYH